MSIAYVIENYINVDTLNSVSSHVSPFYEEQNIYNTRPSLPLRFTGKGTFALPEWICVDMGAPKKVTFAGVLNHNLTIAPPEIFDLQGNNTGCGGGGLLVNMIDRILSDTICSGRYTDIFENSCSRFDKTFQYYRFRFSDTTNPDGFVEVGEVILSQWCRFGNEVYLQPGRPDGPIFFMDNQKTHYGQDWPAYYSHAEHFTLTFKNINDVNNRDELHSFLIRVQRNGGKFILIPDFDDDNYQAGYKERCYYVIIENQSNYANRLIHSWTKELREWTIELKTLTSGIKLL